MSRGLSMGLQQGRVLLRMTLHGNPVQVLVRRTGLRAEEVQRVLHSAALRHLVCEQPDGTWALAPGKEVDAALDHAYQLVHEVSRAAH